MCGMYASVAILAALRHRDRTGIGQFIDLALLDTQVSWLVNHGASPDIKDKHGVSARDRAARKRDKRWLDALG